jgi:RNA polymerase sigma-70 factor (ECF subfamily)
MTDDRPDNRTRGRIGRPTLTLVASTTENRSDLDFESHRRELTGFCYRMLGSGFEAEDAVQETMVRAWKGIDGFEGRSALRSWLYRIAHNVCLDMQRAPQRRARPMDLGPSSSAEAPLAAVRPENTWITPIADARVLPTDGDPAEVAAARDSIRLAFVAALQHLPPKQRAALILCEVLKWQATEAAALLDTSVASVNSALQRARATLEEAGLDVGTAPTTVDADQEELLASYVDAFERYDVESIVALVHDEVQFSMPPYPMWLEGPAEVAKWLAGPGIECAGSRLIATSANGSPAFASYRKAPGGGHQPFAIQVFETSEGRITAWTNFLDTDLFELFGLPEFLPADDTQDADRAS